MDNSVAMLGQVLYVPPIQTKRGPPLMGCDQRFSKNARVYDNE